MLVGLTYGVNRRCRSGAMGGDENSRTSGRKLLIEAASGLNDGLGVTADEIVTRGDWHQHP